MPRPGATVQPANSGAEWKGQRGDANEQQGLRRELQSIDHKPE